MWVITNAKLLNIVINTVLSITGHIRVAERSYIETKMQQEIY
jgi:hypothetical protein